MREGRTPRYDEMSVFPRASLSFRSRDLPHAPLACRHDGLGRWLHGSSCLLGLRRELGWGTSLDATYTGTAGRNMEMYYDLNAVQDGVRYVDLNPPAHDPGSTSPTAAQGPICS